MKDLDVRPTERCSKPATLGIFATVMLLTIGFVAVPALALGQRPIVDIPSTPQPLRDWVDVDGNVLPFYTDEQIKEFLRSSDVIERENIKIGVTAPIRLKLAKGATKVHAIFRYVDTTYDRVRMGDGRVRVNLRDNCHFEAAAYELSRMLGMTNVPPVVTRRIGSDNGTVQIWVYDAVMEDERIEQEMRAPNQMAWIRQVQSMYLFDALIGNDDRTQQNLLIDKNWKLWLIDHTRAFYSGAQSPNLSKVTFVEKGFWEALLALDKASVAAELGEFLASSEIDQLLERRDRVAAHIQELIDTRGEGAVIYEWAPSER